MCFSAIASFTASAILAGVGVASIKKADDQSHKLFASIPIIFATQQLCEGILWLTLKHPTEDDLTSVIMARLFLVFALVVWPSWIPLSILIMEKKEGRKKILKGFSVLGILISLVLAYCLVAYDSRAKISGHHVFYEINFPYRDKIIFGILYIIPTVISPMISSVKKVPVIGILILISYLFSKILFKDHVISVWCFFAAVISIVIYYIIAGSKKI